MKIMIEGYTVFQEIQARKPATAEKKINGRRNHGCRRRKTDIGESEKWTNKCMYQPWNKWVTIIKHQESTREAVLTPKKK